jgi:hypothetical protein
MITIPLTRLESAATTKPQGYYEACLAAGTVVGDNLELSERAFAELRARYAPPPVAAQLRSLAGAVAAECGAALAGEQPVTDAQKANRISICEACEFFTISDRRCSKCGCWVEAKAGFRTQSCPVAKWPPLT